MTKREEIRAASRRLPGDSDLHDLTKYLTGEIYTDPRPSRATYFWGMNADWLTYCRSTLSTHWQPPSQIYAATCLYGYEVEVDEKYGIPKLVRR